LEDARKGWCPQVMREVLTGGVEGHEAAHWPSDLARRLSLVTSTKIFSWDGENENLSGMAERHMVGEPVETVNIGPLDFALMRRSGWDGVWRGLVCMLKETIR